MLRPLPILRFISFLVAVVGFAAAGQAEQRIFTLDPAQSKVEFSLGATLHTVHGSFHLKRGSIHFDDATGAASGELVVDALSGESGNSGRDKNMHKEVLETAKYSEIIFTPQHVKGRVTADGTSQVDVDGQFTLHGQSRPVTMTIQLQLQGGAGSADTTFPVVYKEWGVKNPSTFLLRVSDKAEVSVHAVGKIEGSKP
jgi:polyisoprenoid-binding protein YceI